ncbi:MAG TPA: RNA methyltransferase [Vicinamibacterales bacterium]|nr:RNA methyltransferase [Vicinamibacterales bacterium]
MIHQIDRPDDPRIAGYARVGDHGWLRDRGLFVAEGRLVVSRLLEAWPSAIESILVTTTAHAALPAVSATATPVYVAEASVLQSLTGIDFHRGCLALARRPQEIDPGSLLASERLIALEGIANPDNLGGIFRVAAAFGVRAVLLDPSTADPLYRKAIRTSMGSVFTVPFARLHDWPSGLQRLQATGLDVAALTPSVTAVPLADFGSRPTGRLILMLGSEGKGLGAAALAACDHQVRIPICDDVDSLNVVVAAGIALHALGSHAEGGVLKRSDRS